MYGDASTTLLLRNLLLVLKHPASPSYRFTVKVWGGEELGVGLSFKEKPLIVRTGSTKL
jgi:hypothetical protein